MTNQDQLAQLRDIHLPEAVSAWPPAPGWWVLLGMSTIVGIIAGRGLLQRYRSRLYRRQALQKLSLIDTGNDAHQQLQELFELLRQTADTVYYGQRFGGLSLPHFIDFLQLSGNSQCFQVDQKTLESALYSPPIHNDGRYHALFTRLSKDSRQWIQCHKTRAPEIHPC